VALSSGLSKVEQISPPVTRGLHSSTSQLNVSTLLGYVWWFEPSVGRTCPVYLLKIEGLLTPGWRLGRAFGESVGGCFAMDSDWSNEIRYQIRH